MSFAIYIATASVIAFHRAPFLSYGIQFVNVSKTLGCLWWRCLGCRGLVPFVGSNTSPTRQHASVCLRCCSKLVVQLPLVATAKQTLQRGAVCSVSDATNPNQFQITEETFPFLGMRSSLLAAMLFVYQACRARSELREPSRGGNRFSQKQINVKYKFELIDKIDLSPSPNLDIDTITIYRSALIATVCSTNHCFVSAATFDLF